MKSCKRPKSLENLLRGRDNQCLFVTRTWHQMPEKHVIYLRNVLLFLYHNMLLDLPPCSIAVTEIWALQAEVQEPPWQEGGWRFGVRDRFVQWIREGTHLFMSCRVKLLSREKSHHMELRRKGDFFQGYYNMSQKYLNLKRNWTGFCWKKTKGEFKKMTNTIIIYIYDMQLNILIDVYNKELSHEGK